MKRNQSGFTLIEIAIVLVIIGLLLGGVHFTLYLWLSGQVPLAAGRRSAGGQPCRRCDCCNPNQRG